MTRKEGMTARIRNERPLSDRNVVTSRLATMFGIQSMVCDSRTATVLMNGKVVEGNIMENTFDYICGQTDRHFSNFHAKLKAEGAYIMVGETALYTHTWLT